VAALGFEFGAAMEPGRLAVPIAASGDDVADSAILQTFDGFDVTFIVMAL